MYKIYLKIAWYVALSLFLFGYICPELISAKNDYSVLLGFALIVIVTPWLWWKVYKLIMNLIKHIKEDDSL